jgi:hypothetical protein
VCFFVSKRCLLYTFFTLPTAGEIIKRFIFLSKRCQLYTFLRCLLQVKKKGASSKLPAAVEKNYGFFLSQKLQLYTRQGISQGIPKGGGVALFILGGLGDYGGSPKPAKYFNKCFARRRRKSFWVY